MIISGRNDSANTVQASTLPTTAGYSTTTGEKAILSGAAVRDRQTECQPYAVLAAVAEEMSEMFGGHGAGAGKLIEEDSES